jgi:hypothetical protein
MLTFAIESSPKAWVSVLVEMGRFAHRSQSMQLHKHSMEEFEIELHS